MARAHPWIPPRSSRLLSKSALLKDLYAIDSDPTSRQRVLELETAFRARIATGIGALPAASARFDKFRTNPFVLLMHSMRNGYRSISQIEHDILPAKLFSSMETSAGKMMEEIALPVYGWETVPSAMHTAYSALDGRKRSGDVLTVATLKSGPACLNDEMAENFADAILLHAPTWAKDYEASVVEFSYGVLYGTPNQSNKKDWHILRNLWDKRKGEDFIVTPEKRWHTIFIHKDIEIRASVRIGTDWWSYLGGSPKTNVEIWTAMIRACVAAGPPDPPNHMYVIQDLADIVSLESVPHDFNVSLLQRGQLQWLFFIARHFCDKLVP